MQQQSNEDTARVTEATHSKAEVDTEGVYIARGNER